MFFENLDRTLQNKNKVKSLVDLLQDILSNMSLTDVNDFQKLRWELLHHDINSSVIQGAGEMLYKSRNPFLIISNDGLPKLFYRDQHGKWENVQLNYDQRQIKQSQTSMKESVVLDLAIIMDLSLYEPESATLNYKIKVAMLSSDLVKRVKFLLLQLCIGYVIIMSTTILIEFVGLMASLLFVYFKQIDDKSTIPSILCSSDNNNCFDKNSGFFGYPFESWATVYFTFCLLMKLMMLIGDKSTGSELIRLVTIGAIPIVIMAIIQQINNRQYCQLCIIITGLVAANLLTTNALDYGKYNVLKWEEFAHCIILLMLSMVITQLMIANLITNTKLKGLRNEHLRIFSDPTIIHSFIGKSGISIDNDLIERSLRIGKDTNDSNTIILILHKNCKYCVRAFEEMTKLIRMNDSQVLHIFIAGCDGEHDRQMYMLFAQCCIDEAWNDAKYILNKWKNGYSTINEEVLFDPHLIDLYNINHNYTQVYAGTRFPAMFVNGIQLPSFVDSSSLKVALAM